MSSSHPQYGSLPGPSSSAPPTAPDEGTPLVRHSRNSEGISDSSCNNQTPSSPLSKAMRAASDKVVSLMRDHSYLAMCASLAALLMLYAGFAHFSSVAPSNTYIASRTSNDAAAEALLLVQQRTSGFSASRDPSLLQSAYAPDAVYMSSISVPGGVVRGAAAVANQIVNTRSLASDAAFVPYTLGLSSHTIEKDKAAAVAYAGRYVHSGTDASTGQACEVNTPMHLFQRIGSNHSVEHEWVHMNYTDYVDKLTRCNALNLPVGPEVAHNAIRSIYPDVVDYGWNGTKLRDLVRRFWDDLVRDSRDIGEYVTVELRDLMHAMGDALSSAGVKSLSTSPERPALVIDARSEEWATLTVNVAQEVVGVDVNSGGSCTFHAEWVHAYVIQRHYRVAGFITAGNSNDLRLKLSQCNRYGTVKYGYKNWDSQQVAAANIMDALYKNRFLEKILNERVTVRASNASFILDIKKHTTGDSAAAMDAKEKAASDTAPAPPAARPLPVKAESLASCLCTSDTGCALPGSDPCCHGLVCVGDGHHSECIPMDREHYADKQQQQQEQQGDPSSPDREHSSRSKGNSKKKGLKGGKASQDSTDVIDSTSCILTNSYGCNGGSHPCCSRHAICTADARDRNVCRLPCGMASHEL